MAKARAKSLAFTKVSNGPNGPITQIQNYSEGPQDTLAEFTHGTALVPTRYRAKKGHFIEIETPDLAAVASMAIGQLYTNVILTVEGTVDSGGGSSGSDQTVTLSSAAITQIGELSHSNDDSTPTTQTVRFELNRAATATEDPTVARA